MDDDFGIAAYDGRNAVRAQFALVIPIAESHFDGFEHKTIKPIFSQLHERAHAPKVRAYAYYVSFLSISR